MPAGARLGYGTASLMARLSRAESLRLLSHAYEAGIRYFDTARLYGYGDAEGVLGRFVRDKRDQVTIATKAGILPPRRTVGLSLLRTAARTTVAAVPSLRPLVRRRAEATVQAPTFLPHAVRSSLETSLRELRVDAVDLLLLHECAPEDLSDELFEELEAAVHVGLTRRYGIATHEAASVAILARDRRFAGTVQVADSLVRPSSVVGRAQHPVCHSVFRGDVAALAERIPHAKQTETGLGADVLARRAMLDYAVGHAGPRGVVLFSSLDPRHIAANVLCARQPLFSERELARLAGAALPSAVP